jgi:hypothetical protein
MSRNKVKELAAAAPFASLSGGKSSQECMLHVYWTAMNDAGDNGSGHLVMRGRVTADLGLDNVPVPPFSSEEMQEIMRAAKMGALKCLRNRKSIVKGEG